MDDVGFKELVAEKGRLYSRKVRGKMEEGEQRRLVEVSREVNRTRRRLKREYFNRRLAEIGGELWLGKVGRYEIVDDVLMIS